MTQRSLSKDIEVEVIFTFPASGKGEEPKFIKDYITYLIFGDSPRDMWEAKLWFAKDKGTFPVETPTKTFVEFRYPQSLSGKLQPNKEFNIWASLNGQEAGQFIAKGHILTIVDIEKRAQENSENIVVRGWDETNQVLNYIENLCGKPFFEGINEIFYKNLKKVLGVENIQDYLWLWEKPHCPHTFVDFENPRDIPQLACFLPDETIPIWFLVDVDLFLSGWLLYNGTFTALEKITKEYKFSRYYMVAGDFSWLIQKTNKEFIAIGKDVENKLKHFQVK